MTKEAECGEIGEMATNKRTNFGVRKCIVYNFQPQTKQSILPQQTKQYAARSNCSCKNTQTFNFCNTASLDDQQSNHILRRIVPNKIEHRRNILEKLTRNTVFFVVDCLVWVSTRMHRQKEKIICVRGSNKTTTTTTTTTTNRNHGIHKTKQKSLAVCARVYFVFDFASYVPILPVRGVLSDKEKKQRKRKKCL